MSKTKRYDVTSDLAMLRDDGAWVRYEDHAAALAAERAKVDTKRCSDCGCELSACGEMTSDGPRMDCPLCLANDTYTLLPPHLADQWEELRKAKGEAEQTLLTRLKFGGTEYGDAASTAWVAACEVLAHFESASGIGGGA